MLRYIPDVFRKQSYELFRVAGVPKIALYVQGKLNIKKPGTPNKINTMVKIEDSIKTLNKFKNQGYNYSMPDFFGGNVFRLSKAIHPNAAKIPNFYITLYQDSDDEDDFEPKSSSRIKVEVISHEFENDKDGVISCLLDLKPLEELPKWYKDLEFHNEHLYEDFNNVPLQLVETDGY